MAEAGRGGAGPCRARPDGQGCRDGNLPWRISTGQSRRSIRYPFPEQHQVHEAIGSDFFLRFPARFIGKLFQQFLAKDRSPAMIAGKTCQVSHQETRSKSRSSSGVTRDWPGSVEQTALIRGSRSANSSTRFLHEFPFPCYADYVAGPGFDETYTQVPQPKLMEGPGLVRGLPEFDPCFPQDP